MLCPIRVAKLTAARVSRDPRQRRTDVERRAAAVPGNDRRHPHAHEVRGERTLGKLVSVCVHVDESRRDESARLASIRSLCRPMEHRADAPQSCRPCTMPGRRARAGAPVPSITRAAGDDEVVVGAGLRRASTGVKMQCNRRENEADLHGRYAVRSTAGRRPVDPRSRADRVTTTAITTEADCARETRYPWLRGETRTRPTTPMPAAGPRTHRGRWSALNTSARTKTPSNEP